MRLVVSMKYTTMPHDLSKNKSVSWSITSVTIDSPSTKVSDVKAIIQAKHSGWHNIQIMGIKQA